MTIERLEQIESEWSGASSAYVAPGTTKVIRELIADNRRLRSKLNAIQKAAKEAQDG